VGPGQTRSNPEKTGQFNKEDENKTDKLSRILRNNQLKFL